MKRTGLMQWIPLLLVAFTLQLPCPAYAQETEMPSVLRAGSVLPKKILSGPDYWIDDTVFNDGYLNTYMIHSKFGDFSTVSTALVYTRLAEIEAMAKMDHVSGSAQFGGAIAGKGVQTVKGAVNLVVHPIDSVGGALSGVGKMFVRAHENLVESNPSQYEDSRFKNAIGFSQIKRDYAKQFGVDPYSTNQALQQRLDGLASAGFAGSITGSALQVLIPGGVGIAVSAVSGSAVLGAIDVTVPPADLRRQNREALTGMGVSQAVASLFIDNGHFTPTQQTLIVQALSAMPDTHGKAALVELLVHTDSQDLALFRQRMSQMYAGYDRTVAGLKGFVPIGRFVGAVKTNGAFALAFPLDYLVWTNATAAIVKSMSDFARSYPAPKVELWLTGKASPLARKRLKALGIELHEDAGQKLLGVQQ